MASTAAIANGTTPPAQPQQGSVPVRLNIAIVGLGKRTLKQALHTIEQNPRYWKLVAICDPDADVRELFKTSHPACVTFAAVSEMINWHQHQNSESLIQCAYVAIPIHAYSEALPILLRSNIHVLKEKPAAKTLEELTFLQALAVAQNVRLMIASQRRFGESFQRMREWLPFIGKVHTIEGVRKIVVPDLHAGWRARAVLSNGGALGEIGWHVVDFILNLLGPESRTSVEAAKLFQVRAYQGYDAEDSAHASFQIYPGEGMPPIFSNIVVSRLGPEKVDQLVVTGEDGVLEASRDGVRLHTLLASGQKRISHPISRDSEVGSMFQAFYDEICRQSPSESYFRYVQLDRMATLVLNDMYSTAYQTIPASPLRLAHLESAPVKYQMSWPLITPEIERSVQAQLHENISIYDNSGIFKVFEEEFKEVHGMPRSYALLHNSGSNALQALFFAARFQPADEIIFPVYTFHATVSPSMHFGIRPVFCDASEDGNISPAAIASALTSKTKAVVLTHMWGQPCDMTEILSVLKGSPHVLLLEDCSHAHGGRYDGKPLGTFGDGAAWSLQGQKIITGGEGGIVLTKHADFHYRQLIWGHYNKRCKLEIPKDHELFPYCLTGAGLKTRAHPLATVIALSMLRSLGTIQLFKSKFAAMMALEWSPIPWLTMPELSRLHDAYIEPAWYAFVIRFNQSKAPAGLTREVFVKDINDEGLVDVDIPKSTGLLHLEPLFTHPELLFPHLYPISAHSSQTETGLEPFPNARLFYDEAIKFPVHTTPDHEGITQRYIDVIKMVANRWMVKNEAE